MFGKKRKNNDLGPLKGWAAFAHKTVMFLLYPFRKPLKFLLFVLFVAGVSYAYPIILHNIKPQEVHSWYINQVKNIDTSAINDLIKNKIPSKGTDELVDTSQTPKEVRRQMFAKATSSAPKTFDVLADEADNVVAIEQPEQIEIKEINEVEQNVVTDENPVAKVNNNIVVKKNNNDDVLQYADEQKEIIGEAKVYNANELEVDGTYMFLYGIYSNPLNARGVKAGVFLKSSLKGQQIRCKIVAYTADDVATGECFLGNASINDAMVEKGYSDKVSLQ